MEWRLAIGKGDRMEWRLGVSGGWPRWLTEEGAKNRLGGGQRRQGGRERKERQSGYKRNEAEMH